MANDKGRTSATGRKQVSTRRLRDGSFVQGRSAFKKSPSSITRKVPEVAESVTKPAGHDSSTPGMTRAKSVDIGEVLSADRLTLSRDGAQFDLPNDVIHTLREFVDDLVRGGAPRLVAVPRDGASLSSQQAADLLNVSRPFVVKLARSGQLSHTKTGNRHRFALQDVLEYDAQARRDRDEALREIVPAEGYDERDY